MHWTKSKITRWTAEDGSRITEDPELGERLYRLDTPDTSPEFFASIEEAKRSAALKNELRLVRQDNERMRAELTRLQSGGTWQRHPTPDDFQEDDRPIDPAEMVSVMAKSRPDDDGRGIPTTPHVAGSALHIHAGETQEYPF